MDTYWLLDKSYNTNKGMDDNADSKMAGLMGQSTNHPEMSPTRARMLDELLPYQVSPKMTKTPNDEYGHTMGHKECIMEDEMQD